MVQSSECRGGPQSAILGQARELEHRLSMLLGSVAGLEISEIARKLRKLRSDSMEQGNHTLALSASECWSALTDDPVAHLAHADDIHRTGDSRRAVDHLERAVLRGIESAAVWSMLGQLQEEMIEPHAALACYRRAISLDPTDLNARLGAAMCSFDVGAFDCAAVELEEAEKQAPASPYVALNRGLLDLANRNVDAALERFRFAAQLNRGPCWTVGDMRQHLRKRERDINDPDWGVNRAKLIHDIEQIQYLLERGLVPDYFEAVLEDYVSALEDPRLPSSPHAMVALDPRRYPLFAATYKRPFYLPDAPAFPDAVLNDEIDWRQVESDYFETNPCHVCIDGLLKPEALARLRNWCLQSTYWNAVKGGYLGAYLFDNFCSALLLQISEELRARMPKLLGRFPLGTTWAYKYDASYRGIGVHADVAAVNVNFWITPDEANVDPESGGLLVYSHVSPKDWSFAKFNRDQETIRKFLAENHSGCVRVPYRCNRAMVFDSDLFHETDEFSFRAGYEYRRINITMLFGARQ